MKRSALTFLIVCVVSLGLTQEVSDSNGLMKNDLHSHRLMNKSIIELMIDNMGKPIDMSADMDWDDWKCDWTSDKLIKEVAKLPADNILAFLTENVEDRIESFIPVDFNSDGECDIIVYGNPGGAESNYIWMFMFENGKYDLKLQTTGNILKVFNHNSKLALIVHNYACSTGQIDHVYEFLPNTKDGKFSYDISADIAFFTETLVPSQNMSDQINFSVINGGYRLRANPIIRKKSSSNELVADPDVIATFSKDSKGVAIAESVDDTGRVWWFVIMENTSVESIFEKGYHNNEDYHIVGWMSSRYLRKN